jgi:hypothetical protein
LTRDRAEISTALGVEEPWNQKENRTMGKKNDVPVKEKYRLWWEYFKRSGLYNRLGEKFLSFIAAKEESAMIEWAREERRNNKNIPISIFLLFRELMGGKSIDEWWETNYELTKPRNPKVVDISKNMEEFQDFYFKFSSRDYIPNTGVGKSFFDAKGEERPTLDKGNILLQPLRGDLTINISGLRFWKNKQLEKEIRKLIRSRKEETKSRLGLSGKFRYDKVSKYLEVYDKVESLKKKKLSWEKITREFYPGVVKRLDDENLSVKAYDRILKRISSHERRLKMEYAKAKKIMSNTEKSQFPGKY